MVTGEKTTLEAMGGARVHCAESGVGHFLVTTSRRRSTGRDLPVVPAVELAGRRRLASRDPHRARDRPRRARPGQRAAGLRHAHATSGPPRRGLVLRDPGAVGAEVTVGFGRSTARWSAWSATTRCSRAACSSSTRPTRRPGSSSCATRSTCRCCSCPTCPGFMVGTAVEKQGIIRHGAKMITAVAEATVPEDLRGGAQGVRRRAVRDGRPGLRAGRHAGLPTAKIAVMGAEAAVNAVYANKIAAIEDEAERAAFVEAKRAEYDGTSTSCGSRPSSSSTPSWSRPSCARSWSDGSRPRTARTALLSAPPRRDARVRRFYDCGHDGRQLSPGGSQGLVAPYYRRIPVGAPRRGRSLDLGAAGACAAPGGYDVETHGDGLDALARRDRPVRSTSSSSIWACPEWTG